MFKKIVLSSLFVMILFSIPGPCQAASQINRRDFAMGWQFSRPASGLSLKIPIKADYYIQPIFTFSETRKETATSGHLALGIRGIYEFPSRLDFQPYTGLSIGYSKNFKGDSPDSAVVTNSGLGYEGFFGVEYKKYLLRPALEIGMGGYAKKGGAYFAGVIWNFSLHYYF